MFENATRKRRVALGRTHGSSELLRWRMLWASGAVVFIECNSGPRGWRPSSPSNRLATRTASRAPVRPRPSGKLWGASRIRSGEGQSSEVAQCGLHGANATLFLELGAATYSLPELRTGTKLHLPNRAVPTIITTARHGQAKGALNCRLERWRTRTSLPNWPGRNEPSADRFHRLSVIRRESGLVAIPKLPELRARKVRDSGLFGGR